MKPQKQIKFRYLVESVDKRGKEKKVIVEVTADCDDNARRKIVHATLHDGGRVKLIIPANEAEAGYV